jgi:hypothetical protein
VLRWFGADHPPWRPASPHHPWRPRDKSAPHPSCGSGTGGSVLAHNPASAFLRTSPSPPSGQDPVEAEAALCRRGRRPAALAAATGTVAEGPPRRRHGAQAAGRWSTPTVLLMRRRALEARQCGTPVRGLTLARWALAHQASAGRWTAAGDHAPIVERSITNQQQAHHHHQADPWILPSQPAPRGTVGAQEPSDSPESPKLACPVEQPLTLPVCWTLTVSSAWPFGLSCCVSLAWERTGAPALLGGIDHTSMACRTCSLAWVGLADLCAGLAMRLVRPAGHIYSLRWLTIAVLSSAGGESSG